MWNIEVNVLKIFVFVSFDCIYSLIVSIQKNLFKANDRKSMVGSKHTLACDQNASVNRP